MLLSLALLPESVAASVWGWRIHVLGRMQCREGMTLYLVLKGEPSRMDRTEREFAFDIANEMREFSDGR